LFYYDPFFSNTSTDKVQVKFKEFATAADRSECVQNSVSYVRYGFEAKRCEFSFMSEIEEHGGVFVRRNPMQEGYMYVFTSKYLTLVN